MSDIDDLQAELHGIVLDDLPDDLSSGLKAMAVGIQAEIDSQRSQILRAAPSLQGARYAIFWLKIAVDSARLNKKIRDKIAEFNRQLEQKSGDAQSKSAIALLEKMITDSRDFERDVLEQSALSINRTPDDLGLSDDSTSGFKM
ncbi:MULTISPECIES: hypothetical protein [Xanthomonas]|uniref:hypothetical protein n=1 Tax=Xanthomonas TaxID=338 RepID=UPI001AD9EDA9|nr:hypothetical protein [Xanthomonas phaseoli]MBO9766517.1 hypothetical protein [Xanthomonas phaseoli pv. dieffenbachiae]MBO9776138.1 hypothetical protein [Xanthomonas phaseoli pv. dieffenbachiae]MBO9778264.1 hypothetical protein [Xanthomonas phaseoli pv. dieffenbachiae]MBO9795348.1 hypothetical protein [Xanthomonas phaseoli pv. dieffenbachiae]MBO9801457.1 hypothetical protein [Xanthomonas phaseoli pv. dieffenbachiae]